MARLNGEGSWDEYKSGKYTYQRFRTYVDGERKVFYGRTKTEAMKKYHEYANHHTPGIKKTAITVLDVAKEAVENRKAQLKTTSQDYYANAIKSLEKSEIGALQIHSVTYADLQLYINEMVNSLSLSTIKRQKILMSITFDYADENGWIEKNPMNRVKMPNEANVVKEKREIITLTTEERKILEKEAYRLNDRKIHNGKIGDSLYGVRSRAIVFILHTGLRFGELRGLFWDDVDLSTRFLDIKRNAPSTGNEITTPKKKASYRKIPLDDVAYEIVSELSKQKNGNFVFHTKDGGMLGRNDVDKTLRQMVKRAGLSRKPTLHDLRHTYASELIRNGVDMKTVSVVLGHADISTTMNIYVHKSDDDLEKLKNILL